jgi:hypothetical protein
MTGHDEWLLKSVCNVNHFCHLFLGEIVMSNIVFVIASVVFSAEPFFPVATPPEYPPPRFGIAVIDEKGGIEVRYTEAIPVWEQRQRTKVFQVRDGEKWKTVTETTPYQVRLYKTKTVVETRDAGQYRVFQNGTELDETNRKELLKQPRRIVFLDGGSPNAVSGFYLDLLAKDTLLVLLGGLQTPETKVAPKKLPPAASPSPTISTKPQNPPDGRFWDERLGIMQDGVNPMGNNFKGLLSPIPDSNLNVVYIVLRKRPDVVPKVWETLPIGGSYGGKITWFGHQSSDGPRGAARISFGISKWKPGQSFSEVQYYLSVIDGKTKPRLVLTTDVDKASLWSLTAEKTWSYNDADGEGRVEQTAGYIQLTGVPGVQLWLAISPEPIMGTQGIQAGIQGKTREIIMECRLLTVSPKKECLFRYDRFWSVSN